VNGEADFTIIVMRDISRWGRWPDEEASVRCEYLCRKAGIDVRYMYDEKFTKEKIDPAALMKAVRNAVT
jgi:DNA invertase Pin-like site-specific DNA recombinase